MRYVFTGPSVVTPVQMPDIDARDSYFAGCTLSGDFSSYDFRNASLFQCSLVGDFRGTRTAYMTSVECDWSQALLPPDFSPHKHDLIVAVIAQKIPTLTSQRRDAAERIVAFITHRYDVSWENCFRRLHEAGYTFVQIRNFFLDIFDGYPALIETLRAKVQRGKLDFAWTRPARIPINVDGEIDLLTDSRVAGEDRWAIERTLEVPGWRVHMIGTRPFPQAVAIEEALNPDRLSRWDWWA